MSRTAEILEKALLELGATEEEPEAPSSLELLLAESIKLAKLQKVAQFISKADFVTLHEEMRERYRDIGQIFAYYSAISLFDMCSPDDFEDTVAGREKALKAYKQTQICIAQLEVPAGWR